MANWGAKRKRSFVQAEAAAATKLAVSTRLAAMQSAKQKHDRRSSWSEPGSARFNALLAVAARMFQESYPDSASETVPSTKRVRSNHFKSHIQNATSVRAQQLRLPALKIKVPFAVQDAAAEGHTAQPQQHRRLNNPAHMDSDSSACSATSSELGVRILASRDSNTTPIQHTIVRQQPPIKLYLQTSSGLPRVLTHDQPPYQVGSMPVTASVHRRKRKPFMGSLSPQTPKSQQIRGKHSLKDIKATDFVCYACNTRSTPTWRWFRDRLVCNACGLRFARGKARMQLHQQ